MYQYIIFCFRDGAGSTVSSQMKVQGSILDWAVEHGCIAGDLAVCIVKSQVREKNWRKVTRSEMRGVSKCITMWCCPLSFPRKYYKRLKQSFTQFWAVMIITRNTVKRRHWRKVDERDYHSSSLAEFLSNCLLILLYSKYLHEMSLTQY